ncbi:MAG: NERD domain-containing protein [Deinococcus sp.]|nr:NERD domain-containing protein [Deinococcus sp.]
MIIKEQRERPGNTARAKAGERAERQMAFYLRRAFADSPEVLVFHDLHLRYGGEHAQLDHLIFHRAGLIIIESKSVTSAVKINAREEWARQWEGAWKGMPSPLLQAHRQGEVLRKLLNANAGTLRSRLALGLLQGGFGALPVDVLVAISDDGLVHYERELPHIAAQVKKADQIPERVTELMAHHRKLASVFNLGRESLNRGLKLPEADFEKTRDFLLAHAESSREHPASGDALRPPAASSTRPRAKTQPATAQPSLSPGPSPKAPGELSELPQCSQCGSQRLSILYKHSYYFKCADCQGNTAIRRTCPQCGALLKTRKQGQRFYGECPGCGTSEHFFTNP